MQINSIPLFITLALAAGQSPAHTLPDAATATSAALGEVRFPTSTRSPQAQAAFIEGMLLLHVFEYPAAQKAFERAEQFDPEFAMAYWGEAMTYTHPVWNQQDLEAGRAALAKLAVTPQARAGKAATAREKDFLQAAEILYGEGSKRERDQRLLQAMESMATRYPDDDEVQLFLSLALLGANEGVRDLPAFLRAADIAKAVYRHNPMHPGAAHYWIHGMDDPAHAEGALEAARALSKIAPGAGHSQHMTSHIFMALGLWDDVVASNIAAERVVNEGLRAKGQPPFSCGHYSEWLQYAYFQQGREREGYQVLLDCQRDGRAALAWSRAHPMQPFLAARNLQSLKARLDSTLVTMRAAVIVDAPRYRRQASAIDLDVSDIGRDQGWALFSRGLEQAWRGDEPRATQTLVSLRKIADLPDEAGDNGSARHYLAIMAQMLEAVIAQREGRVDEGIRLASAAAQSYDALPFDFGPPATVKPPRELLGEMLLAAGRRDEARAQFELSLKAAPRRALSRAGLERATVR